MFETFGFESVTPLQASVVLGLAIGVVYGLLAQRSRFCLRRGVTGAWKDCLPALGTWVMALATAIAGTQLAIVADLISLETHRFLAHQLAGACHRGGRSDVWRRDGMLRRMHLPSCGSGRNGKPALHGCAHCARNCCPRHHERRVCAGENGPWQRQSRSRRSCITHRIPGWANSDLGCCPGGCCICLAVPGTCRPSGNGRADRVAGPVGMDWNRVPAA